MNVFKFGGASICDADSVRNLGRIIKLQDSTPLVIVVSAMGKSTNLLEKILDLKLSNNRYRDLLERFNNYHVDICHDLFPVREHLVHEKIEQLMTSLGHLLETPGSDYDELYDQVIPHGELTSTVIVHSYLTDIGLECELLDARKMVITDSTYREGKVIWDLTCKAINLRINPKSEYLYLTQGFIAANENGNTVTLGREGSDFSAAILAYCLDAESVTIWKDVPGVLNADPARWKHTVKYPLISYGEAAEMTYYGASVIHPKTIRPLALKNIPLMVKSFKDPSDEGSRIADIKHETLEPTIIFKGNQCLISFQVHDLSFINESKISVIFHLFEELNIRVNMMQSSAVSFSVCVDNPDRKMKNLINRLSSDYDIFYNDQLELITVRNYNQQLIDNIIKGKEILLEQKTRKNYQVLVAT
jgi:aspartate kinase